jgi:tetratricopeptide (TPR) repeat protein
LAQPQANHSGGSQEQTEPLLFAPPKFKGLIDRLKKLPRPILITAAGALVLLIAAAVWLIVSKPPVPAAGPAPDPDILYETYIGELTNWVEGSETPKPPPRPAFLTELRQAGGRSAILARGTEEFIQELYDQALASFQEAGAGLPPDPRLVSLQAAANLRLLNYGQAKSLYLEALALRNKTNMTGDLSEAADRLGLALCLFHEPNPDGSLQEASQAWNIRKEKLGATAPPTLAALNIMATSLIALSRTAAAGDLLLEAVNQALEEGTKPSDPSLLDSLSILALAFEAQGREDELSILFRPLDEANEPASASGSPPAGDETAQALSQPAIEPPIDILEANRILMELKAAHPDSAVLPALALNIVNSLTGGASPACSGSFSSDHLPQIIDLCLEVARGYGRLGMGGEMVRILENFSALPPTLPGTAEKLFKVNELLSAYLASTGDLPGAEKFLRLGLQNASSSLAEPAETAQALADKLITNSLRLADNLIAQGRPPIEAELELTTAVTKLEALLKDSDLNLQPLAPVLFMRLGQILKTINRQSDSRAYLDRAGKAISSAAKAQPEKKEYYNSLSALMDKLKRVSSRNANTIDLTVFYRVLLPSDPRPMIQPSPEVMRLELSALKLLGQLNEFRPMIDAALAWAAQTHGLGSPAHRRYQSLFLKFLEESEDMASLLAALDELAANPGFPPGREALAIQTSALRYKARVLKDHGRIAEAAAALSEARNLLASQPEFAERLREIESEIQSLIP